ncbi:T6SS effector amidase Tae4 family protein [Pandoraea sp. NPDC090278]|uniref:T6SS effector amidase Tae4 family protein n=1 Tax=Pandoraea sp. NPDC090278 TaxID=3364391 RepID=UPI00383A1A10
MAIHLSFNDLWAAYPQPDHGNGADARLSRLSLFRQIGWEGRVDLPAFENTCAVRMSIALIACGVNVDGNDLILAGQYKGAKVETNRLRLSERLKGASYLGAPRAISAFSSGAHIEIHWNERGIVSFDHMIHYDGGHIDLMRNGDLPFAYASGDISRIWRAPIRSVHLTNSSLDYDHIEYADMRDTMFWFRSRVVYFWPLP